MRKRAADIHRGAFPGVVQIEPKNRIDFQPIEESLRAAYRQIHLRYRQDDELDAATENHRHLARTLHLISASFGRPISVLDAGCGTGRSFHCLKKTAHLVGIDLSQEMLMAAQTPVRREEISAERIDLICGNVHLLSFAPRSFYFIYSLGMFGNGCPVTVEICNKFHDWLTPDGKLFFNALDVATFPLATRLRRRLRRLLMPMLSTRWRAVLKQREGPPFFGLTKSRLGRILAASPFREFKIRRQVRRSPLWHGVHLECTALK